MVSSNALEKAYESFLHYTAHRDQGKASPALCYRVEAVEGVRPTGVSQRLQVAFLQRLVL